jgi:hypothetical protein
MTENPKSKISNPNYFAAWSNMSGVRNKSKSVLDTGAFRSDAGWEERENGLVLKDGNAEYDLMERVSRFGEEVVRFSKAVPRSPTTNRLGI